MPSNTDFVSSALITLSLASSRFHRLMFPLIVFPERDGLPGREGQQRWNCGQQPSGSVYPVVCCCLCAWGPLGHLEAGSKKELAGSHVHPPTDLQLPLQRPKPVLNPPPPSPSTFSHPPTPVDSISSFILKMSLFIASLQFSCLLSSSCTIGIAS